ncbi:MAG: tetratricopeptide repeat protein [Massilia sp.]
MSLLMQALRKAESAKKAQGPDAPAPADAAGPTSAAVPAVEAAAPASMSELTLEKLEPTREQIADAEKAAAEAAAAVDADALESYAAAPSGPVVAERSTPPAAQTPEPVDYFSGETPPARTPYIPPADPVPAVVIEKPAPPATPEPAPAATSARLKTGTDAQQAMNNANQAAQARQAAGTVFASKQRARNRRPLIIGAVGLLLLSAAGAYGYYQYMRLASPAPFAQAVPVNVPGPVPVPVAAAPGVTTDPAVAATADGLAPAVSAEPAQALPKASLPAKPAVAAKPAVVSGPVEASEAQPRRVASRPAPRQAAIPASEARAAASIALVRSEGTRQISPVLANAYKAFIAGDSAAARSQYQRVLQSEPDNRDALLGMAAIAVNRGQAAEAGSFYARLLELDPTDAEAAAGLASVERSDPAQSESRLKKVLAASPQNGAALFALGNVYAQQARWPEAQQSFFSAFGVAPTNADYAFNLAVSLDKLNQKKLALDYYQRTLQLAQQGPANVNQAVVKERIRLLQQEAAAAPR